MRNMEDLFIKLVEFQDYNQDIKLILLKNIQAKSMGKAKKFLKKIFIANKSMILKLVVLKS